MFSSVDLSTLRHRMHDVDDQPYEPNREVGKPNLRRFIIAVKRLNGSWPRAATKVISEARRQYDSGKYIMCTGICRKTGVTILYLWRRRRPVKPINYFCSEENHGMRY